MAPVGEADSWRSATPRRRRRASHPARPGSIADRCTPGRSVRVPSPVTRSRRRRCGRAGAIAHEAVQDVEERGIPGWMSRSEKTRTRRERSPDIASTPSTCPDPRSYSTLLTSPMHSFAPTPGRRTSSRLLVRGVDHGRRWGADPPRRPSYPRVPRGRPAAVDDGDADGLEGEEDGWLDDVDAERSAATVLASTGNLAATSSARAAEGGMGPARVEMPARRAVALVLALGRARVQRWRLQLVVAGRRAEPHRTGLPPRAGRRSVTTCPSPRCRCGSRSCSGCRGSRRLSSGPSDDLLARP